MPLCHIMPSFPVLNSLQRYPRPYNCHSSWLNSTQQGISWRPPKRGCWWEKWPHQRDEAAKQETIGKCWNMMTFYCQWIGLVAKIHRKTPIFNGKTFGFLQVFPTEPIHRYRLTNGNLTSSEPKTSHFAFIPQKKVFLHRFWKYGFCS